MVSLASRLHPPISNSRCCESPASQPPPHLPRAFSSPRALLLPPSPTPLLTPLCQRRTEWPDSLLLSCAMRANGSNFMHDACYLLLKWEIKLRTLWRVNFALKAGQGAVPPWGALLNIKARNGAWLDLTGGGDKLPFRVGSIIITILNM